jgi:NAD(P)-dependent dehydrogenase (short-subunit alcohol dehydrogenase family)
VTLEGRTIVVTGASSGIGEAGAVELARRGASVVPVGRDPERLSMVAGRIHKASTRHAEPEQADFASLDNVRALADRLEERCERIDVLVNNAGLRTDRREVSVDGHDLTFQVNHLAPFLLTNLLLERLRASAPARVVTTSSDAHERGEIVLDDLDSKKEWSSSQSYANSKLASVLFTRELARRIPDDEVVANCFDPGVTRTRIRRDAPSRRPLSRLVAPLFFRSPERGAEGLAYLAEAPEAGEISGGYFVDCQPAQVAPKAEDPRLAEELWSVSCKLTGLADR